MSDILYTLSDGQFYESPQNYQFDDSVDDSVWSILREELGRDWLIRHDGIWLIASPPGQHLLPETGYKLHVSGRPESREEVLRIVTQVAYEADATFKCLSDLHIWRRLHDKPFASEFPIDYGKTLTIYPETTAFTELARKLAEELTDFTGPDILSDSPVGTSRSVYYRYGRILSTEDDPQLVPSAISLPEPEEQEEEGRHPIDDYAIQTSVTGGVYFAETHAGVQVVIKEGAEDACVDVTGSDAIERLESEQNILKRLAGADFSPKPLNSFHMWRNRYLVMERLPGEPLTQLHHKRISVLQRLEIAAGVAAAISELHETHKILWGDASPANVLFDETCKVYLVDYEFASELTELTDPETIAVDIKALGYLLVWIFAPVNVAIFKLDATAIHRFLNVLQDSLPIQLIRVIKKCLNMTMTTTARAVATTIKEIRPQDFQRTGESETSGISDISIYQKLLTDSVAFIKAHLTFDRQDRLMPCSPDGFLAPLSKAYGASGVLKFMQMLCENDLAVQIGDWIRAHRDFSDEQKLLSTPGYWSGTAGIAILCRERFGRVAEHIRTTDRLDIYDGAAGIVTAALTRYKDTHDDFYLDTANRLGEHIIARAVAVSTDDGTRIWKSPDDDAILMGYLFGVAGIASVLLQLAYLLNNQRFTDIAEQALLWVEKNCVAEDGCIATPITAGEKKYARSLAHGSAGIAKAFIDTRDHFGSDRDTFIRDLLLPTDRHQLPAFSFTPAPGYWYGLAGIGEQNLDAFRVTAETVYLQNAESILQDLLCFKIDHDDAGAIFPGGDELNRLSCDFATGSIGVVHFIYGYLKLLDVDSLQ